MHKKVADSLKKYHAMLLYIALGAVTTAVNFAVYYPLLNIFNCSATWSNVIAWFVAVLFAFFTNKPFVFKSNNWTLTVIGHEFAKFVSCRIGSGLIETAFLMITVDVLCWNGNALKLFISIFVVIVNYIASKYFVFRK